MAKINMRAAAKKAKQIRKRHPQMKWVTAMSQAMKSQKKKVGSSPRKKARKKSTVKKIKRLHAAEGRAIRSLGSVASHVSHAKKILESEIGKLETRKFVAGKKSTKKKIAKLIARKKSQFRKLC